jgi:hypothetical protein
MVQHSDLTTPSPSLFATGFWASWQGLWDKLSDVRSLKQPGTILMCMNANSLSFQLITLTGWGLENVFLLAQTCSHNPTWHFLNFLPPEASERQWPLTGLEVNHGGPFLLMAGGTCTCLCHLGQWGAAGGRDWVWCRHRWACCRTTCCADEGRAKIQILMPLNSSFLEPFFLECLIKSGNKLCCLTNLMLPIAEWPVWVSQMKNVAREMANKSKRTSSINTSCHCGCSYYYYRRIYSENKYFPHFCILLSSDKNFLMVSYVSLCQLWEHRKKMPYMLFFNSKIFPSRYVGAHGGLPSQLEITSNPQ